MDSFVDVTVVGGTPEAAQRAFAAVRAEVERLESILSDYRPTSNVSRLNRRETDVLAPETAALLDRAQTVCRETGGAFDVSLRPIKHLWGFGSEAGPHVPDSAAVRQLLEHVGCEVYTVLEGPRLRWNDPQAEIDLGGIAQGWVAGRMAAILEARGFADYLINVSGDVLASGERPGGGAWRIGVQNPRLPDSLLAVVPLRWRAVTTSGDYEQSFFAGGVRYHHIFDPATGWPARGACSVTLFSDDPVAADGYATAVFVMGRERGLAFLERRADLEGLILVETTNGDVQGTWGPSRRETAASVSSPEE